MKLQESPKDCTEGIGARDWSDRSRAGFGPSPGLDLLQRLDLVTAGACGPHHTTPVKELATPPAPDCHWGRVLMALPTRFRPDREGRQAGSRVARNVVRLRRGLQSFHVPTITNAAVCGGCNLGTVITNLTPTVCALPRDPTSFPAFRAGPFLEHETNQSHLVDKVRHEDFLLRGLSHS